MKKVEKDGKVVEVIFTDEDLDAWTDDPWGPKWDEMQTPIDTLEEGLTLRFDFRMGSRTHNICVRRFKNGKRIHTGNVPPGGASRDFSGVKITNRCRRP